MRQSNFIIFSFIFSLIMGVCSYLMTTNIVMFCITFTVFFAVFSLILRKCINRYLDVQRRSHESYKFVNSFVINLSVSQSIEKAFDAGRDGLGEDFNKVIDSLDGDSRDKTYYLINYFESNIYQMFLNILKLYEEQGGDILALSNSLLLELSRIEESNNLQKKEGIRCLKEFLTMWAFALLILLFMRFGLSTFFDYLKANIVFISGVGVFLSFFLVSLTVYCFIYTKTPLKKLRITGRRQL